MTYLHLVCGVLQLRPTLVIRLFIMGLQMCVGRAFVVILSQDSAVVPSLSRSVCAAHNILLNTFQVSNPALCGSSFFFKSSETSVHV